ncbi:hypothetical protein BC830DRAFT_1114201 [Chytriomyces sp. MP71]|nr:hypothetical protein BC830DRAFT_1114201 [Chytriomyces sp. MP71]
MMASSVRDQIFFVLGAFITLSIQNTFFTAKRWFSKRTIVDHFQLVASVAQLADTSFLASFIGLPANSFGNCYLWALGGSVFYYTFQIVSAGILIVRATVLLTGILQIVARMAAFALLMASMASNIIGTSHATAVVDGNGFCSVDYNWHNTNDISKYMLTVLFLALLICFIIPVINHMNHVGSESTSEKLRRIATSFGGKVSLAIIGFLLPQIFPLIFSANGSLAGLQAVGFVIQNYFGLVASTIAEENDNSRKNGNDKDLEEGSRH